MWSLPGNESPVPGACIKNGKGTAEIHQPQLLQIHNGMNNAVGENVELIFKYYESLDHKEKELWRSINGVFLMKIITLIKKDA